MSTRFRNLTNVQKKEVARLMNTLHKKHKFPKSMEVSVSTHCDCRHCTLNEYGTLFGIKGTPCLHILQFVRTSSDIEPIRDLDIDSCLDWRREAAQYLQFFESSGHARGLVKI